MRYIGIYENYGMGSPGFHISIVDMKTGNEIASGPFSSHKGIWSFKDAGFREVRRIAKDGRKETYELERIGGDAP